MQILNQNYTSDKHTKQPQLKEKILSQISETALEFRGVSKSFGALDVLRNLNLTLPVGKVYSIIGESGCGKTTALRLMNGLERPTSGEVYLNGEGFDYSMAVSIRRSMGYCLQGYTLFPHMNIFENMSVIARKSGWDKVKIKKRALEVMELMGLSASEYLDKKPSQLSGGQQQRIGIARAIFMNPQILLMDEPFGALDPITRNEIQEAFIELQKKLSLTVVLVTHDLAEAFKMSHEILLLEKGHLAQRGRPNKLLMQPATSYVTHFLKTHSPGHLLEEIPMYTVMFSDVCTVRKEGGGFVIGNLDDEGVAKYLPSRRELLSYINKKSDLRFFIDNNRRLTEYVGPILKDTDSLLDGLKTLLSTKEEVLPVVNKEACLVGAFGKEALDALS